MLSTLILSSDPVATRAADARRHAAVVQPTPAELVAIAIADTDFQAEITPRADVMYLAAEYADQAAGIWEDERGEEDPIGKIISGWVLPDIIEATRALLIVHANEVLDDAAEALADAQADARADAMDAGDFDGDGEAVGYETYRGI